MGVTIDTIDGQVRLLVAAGDVDAIWSMYLTASDAYELGLALMREAEPTLRAAGARIAAELASTRVGVLEGG